MLALKSLLMLIKRGLFRRKEEEVTKTKDKRGDGTGGGGDKDKRQGESTSLRFLFLKFLILSLFLSSAHKNESKMSTMAEKQDGQTLNSKFNINT